MRNNAQQTDFRADLTVYGDSELSLNVFNDEDLYKMMRRTRDLNTMREYLEESFIFNDDQWAELVEDIDADRAEDEDSEATN